MATGSTLVILAINVRVVMENFPAFGKYATDLWISTVSLSSSREIAVPSTPAITMPRPAVPPPKTFQSKF